MKSNTIDNTFNEKQQELIDTINTIAIAKITKIDNEKMKCNIKLIDMPEILGTRDEVEEIENVPILPMFWNDEIKINAMYKKDDKVVVVFCQHSTFNARNSDEPVIADNYSKYDINNALVIAHIPKDSEKSKYKDDFYILHNKTEFRVAKEKVYIKTKDIDIKANNKIMLTTNTQTNQVNTLTHNGSSVDVTVGSMTINCPTVKVNGNVEISGNLVVGGNGVFAGISTATDHISSGKSGKGHTHIDSRGGTTSPPQ